ncbi:hypothetical protein Tco_0763882 [Tanacetum coccineum]
MSATANVTPVINTVKNTGAKEKTPKETDALPKASILDLCEKHYEDILPIIMDRARHDKRKEVQTRLDFGESSKKTQRARDDSLSSRDGRPPTRYRHTLEKSKTDGGGRNDDKSVFNRLSHHKKSVLEQLSDAYSPSTTKSGPSRASSRDHSHGRGRLRSRDHPRVRDRLRGAKESYGYTYSSRRTRTKYRDRSYDKDCSRSMKRRRVSESLSSRVSFLQNILDLYFKHFKLSEDVVNRILQVVLDLQHFKSSLFIFAATILQSSSAIHHISNIDNYVHQIIKIQSILITSRCVNSCER